MVLTEQCFQTKKHTIHISICRSIAVSLSTDLPVKLMLSVLFNLQFYLYEALPGECNNTNPAPSHVCPFAIVPFSYDDASSKATMSGSQKQRYCSTIQT